MKEIDPIVEIDTEIGHVVGIETTLKMTIEKKIIGISKTRDIREDIKIIIKTHTVRINIELTKEARIGAKIDTKIETNTEVIAMTELELGLKKNVTYMMRMIYLTQRLKECTKFYKQ